jgi:hypothetical protein
MTLEECRRSIVRLVYYRYIWLNMQITGQTIVTETDNLRSPNTRTVVLEGLRQALQARVAQVWTTVTMAGEQNREERFKTGFMKAIEAYEQAWSAIDKHMR